MRSSWDVSRAPHYSLSTPAVDIVPFWGPHFSVSRRWRGSFPSAFVRSHCTSGQHGESRTLWGAQGQALAVRAGNVMICSLGITECLLAASGENVPEGGADHSKAGAGRAHAFQQRGLLGLRWWMACAIRWERECQSRGGKGLLFTPRVPRIAEIELVLLFGTLEVCICVDSIPWAHPPSPNWSLIKWWILPSELVT